MMATLTDRFSAAKRAFLNPTELHDTRVRLKIVDHMLETENDRNLDLLGERDILRRELTEANTTALLYEAAAQVIPEEFRLDDRTLAGRIVAIVDALAEARSQLAPIVLLEELEHNDPDFGYFDGEEPERDDLPRIVIPDEKPRKAPRKSSKTTSKRKPAPKGKKARK